VPGQQIPHDLPARAAAYRGQLAGTHTLVILDDAADANQVRPLLPETPGCPVLVTSRRSLTDLHHATHVAVDVFTPGEALELLARATADVPVGRDRAALARIARRCGYLPLALGLVAGHIRDTPGWSLTDHADRLDERHDDRRLDTGVQRALNLSYRHLPTGPRRLLRRIALHPGPDLDAYAAAALAGDDLSSTEANLRHLGRDHLLQQANPGRYTLHDLVRAYATDRGGDEDPPPDRRTALTRLFDYYLATTAAAMNTLYPAEAHRRPGMPQPANAAPILTDPDIARAWLDTERPTLVALTAQTPTTGWTARITRLSSTLFRYLDGGHSADALTVHGHALRAARQAGDPAAQADALTNLGIAHGQRGDGMLAVRQLRQALRLFRAAGDLAGQARSLDNLGTVEERQSRRRPHRAGGTSVPADRRPSGPGPCPGQSRQRRASTGPPPAGRRPPGAGPGLEPTGRRPDR
jgi:NB-ARC domain-containing protein